MEKFLIFLIIVVWLLFQNFHFEELLFQNFHFGGHENRDKIFIRYLYRKLNFKKNITDEMATKFNLTKEQLGSIKYFWTIECIMRCKPINKNDYKANILELSRKYRAPPLYLLSKILKKSKLSKEDLDQVEIANENDDYSFPDTADQLKRSLEFENEIANKLKAENIEFKTQSQLLAENATATPDFLISGQNYKWIEVKNFYGPDIAFIKKKIFKQAAKYLKLYGPGIVLFKWGCSNAYKLNGVRFGEKLNEIFRKK